jgi:hypothetical protein
MSDGALILFLLVIGLIVFVSAWEGVKAFVRTSRNDPNDPWYKRP